MMVTIHYKCELAFPIHLFNPDLSFFMSKPMEHPRENQKQHLTSTTRKRGQILMGWSLKHTTSRFDLFDPSLKA